LERERKKEEKNSSATIRITINDLHCSIRKMHSGAPIKTVKEYFWMLGGVTQKDVSASHVSMSAPHAPPFIIIYIWVDTKLPPT
jgi:hypothetical protein